MQKAILWATLWSLLAVGNIIFLVEGVSNKWFSIVLVVASSYLAIIHWLEVRALRRRNSQSSAEQPAA